MPLQTLYLIPEGTVFCNGDGIEEDDDWYVIQLKTLKPIRAILTYSESESGIQDSVIPWCWFLSCDENLNCSWGYGYTIEEALRSLGFDFTASWDCYVNEDEDKLSEGAIEFRETLKECFEVVGGP